MRVTVYPSNLAATFHREAAFGDVGGNRVRMWAGHDWKREPGEFPCLTVYDVGTGLLSPGYEVDIPVPDWLYKAWMDNGPLNVLFDWLLENRAERFPWLEILLNSPTFTDTEQGD